MDKRTESYMNDMHYHMSDIHLKLVNRKELTIREIKIVITFFKNIPSESMYEIEESNMRADIHMVEMLIEGYPQHIEKDDIECCKDKIFKYELIKG